MNSFNVYGQTEKVIGGNTPVWLGTVKPIPRGTVVSNEIKAGTLGQYYPESGIFSPLTDLNSGGGSIMTSCNAYAYNDVHFEQDSREKFASCAIVMHHPEGLLIERVYPEITEEQIATLQAQIPGVLLVRG